MTFPFARKIGRQAEVTNQPVITPADLAVVDAALYLHNQQFGREVEGAVRINPGDAAFTPVVEVAVVAVEVTLVAYHAYNSWLQGGDNSLVELTNPATAVQVKTRASVDQLIEARNLIAEQLGAEKISAETFTRG